MRLAGVLNGTISKLWYNSAQRVGYFVPQKSNFKRRLSHSLTEAKAEAPQQKARIWPRQNPPSVEAVTPPSSTSVASTSKEPLLKDLFAGRIHLELLEFPELTTKDEVSRVVQLHERIKHAILQVDSAAIDRDCRLPREVLPHLARHGLFGIQADQNVGGQGLNHTEAARIWESAALDGAVYSLLDAHNSLALKTIMLAGTEEQKYRFLPSLTTGDDVAAFCLHEVSSGSDLEAITATATLAEDGKTYVLNGEKTWVTNGAIATKLIVFARTKAPDQTDPAFSAFVVDRKSPGIESSDVLNTLGMHGANVTNLRFHNVRVPFENRLGESWDQTMQLADNVYNHERLTMSTACMGLLRYLLSYATEHCLQRHQFGRPLGNFEMIQAKLAEITMNVYAMESATFYLTGLLDAQPSRDLKLEIAALKIFSSEALWSGVNECLQICGRIGLLKDVPFERYLRDARSFLIHGTPNEVLRLLIAGSAIKHIGPSNQELASKARYALTNPRNMFGFYLRATARKNGLLVKKVGAGPKVTEGGASRHLADHLHHKLTWSATRLAWYTQRFQTFVEAMLCTDGAAITDKQLSQERMANCAIDLFLLTIVLGRASRAISIGVHLHDFEIRLANSFARTVVRRVESNFQECRELDLDKRRIASELLTHRGYPVSHPLTRVW